MAIARSAGMAEAAMPRGDIVSTAAADNDGISGKIVPTQWNFGWFMPDWWPKIAWPWFVFVGCVVTVAISVLVRTPETQIAAVDAHVAITNHQT
jgi:hypothetical protein